jgi:hypothetical protein
MKSALTALMLLVSATAFCWSPSLRIKNNTNCSFTMMVFLTYGTQPPYGCSAFYSDPITVPANSDFTITAAAVNPSSMPLGARNFVGASISNGLPACANNLDNIGNSCTAYPTSVVMSMLGGASCTLCGNVTATWSDPGGTPSSMVTFN